MKKKAISIIEFVLIALSLVGCTKSSVVSSNLSEDADNFEVIRKLSFINSVNNEALYTVEGNFSIYADSSDYQLEVTVKQAMIHFKSIFLGYLLPQYIL